MLSVVRLIPVTHNTVRPRGRAKKDKIRIMEFEILILPILYKSLKMSSKKEDNPKNEDDSKNEESPKKEDNQKRKTTQNMMMSTKMQIKTTLK